jgi:FkbM family methyltransferase
MCFIRGAALVLCMVDTSQYAEGQFITDFLTGRAKSFCFADIGAADGITNSNTKMLAALGWQGVLVEPSPPMFCALMRNYYGHPRVSLVNAAIAPESGLRLRTFHVNTSDGMTGDQVSCFTEAHRDKWKGYPFQSVSIPAISWAELIERHPMVLSADFVNIDVEGINREVFDAMPMRPEMVCVELDPDKEVWDAVNAKYPNCRRIGGNVVGWK